MKVWWELICGTGIEVLMMKYDVLTSGYVSMDRIIRIASPAQIGYTSLVTNADNTKIQYGGCSVNIAVALCKLGQKAMPLSLIHI